VWMGSGPDGASWRVTTTARVMTRYRDLVFRLAAAGAVVATVIHVLGLTIPAFAAANYPDYPAWRHGVFIAINLSAAWVFLRRPAWFVWAFAVLTLQAFYSHGGSAWASWQRDGLVRWIDLAALVAIPTSLALLIADRNRRS
jgi:hypothetical protein